MPMILFSSLAIKTSNSRSNSSNYLIKSLTFILLSTSMNYLKNWHNETCEKNVFAQNFLAKKSIATRKIVPAINTKMPVFFQFTTSWFPHRPQ